MARRSGQGYARLVTVRRGEAVEVGPVTLRLGLFRLGQARLDTVRQGGLGMVRAGRARRL